MALRLTILTNESEIFRVGGAGRRHAELDEAERATSIAAEDIFGGRFSELRRFRCSLEGEEVSMAIVTHARGLIDGARMTTPYEGYCQGDAIAEVEKRHGLSEAVRERCRRADRVLVCLPNDLLAFLLDRGALPLEKCMLVASPSMHGRLEGSLMVLERRGARLGRGNAGRVREALEGMRMEKDGADAGI